MCVCWDTLGSLLGVLRVLGGFLALIACFLQIAFFVNKTAPAWKRELVNVPCRNCMVLALVICTNIVLAVISLEILVIGAKKKEDVFSMMILFLVVAAKPLHVQTVLNTWVAKNVVSNLLVVGATACVRQNPLVPPQNLVIFSVTSFSHASHAFLQLVAHGVSLVEAVRQKVLLHVFLL